MTANEVIINPKERIKNEKVVAIIVALICMLGIILTAIGSILTSGDGIFGFIEKIGREITPVETQVLDNADNGASIELYENNKSICEISYRERKDYTEVEISSDYNGILKGIYRIDSQNIAYHTPKSYQTPQNTWAISTQKDLYNNLIAFNPKLIAENNKIFENCKQYKVLGIIKMFVVRKEGNVVTALTCIKDTPNTLIIYNDDGTNKMRISW